MNDKLVEMVARAIYRERLGNFSDEGRAQSIVDAGWCAWTGEAKAAIEAAGVGELVEALVGLTDHYTQLVNCGDCGNWDPETEPQVIAARTAIAKALGDE